MRIQNFDKWKYSRIWKKSHKAEENIYIIFQHELNITKSANTDIKKSYHESNI